MKEATKKRIEELGLSVDEFEPKKKTEDVTIEDLVEALDILTGIVLGEE